MILPGKGPSSPIKIPNPFLIWLGLVLTILIRSGTTYHECEYLKLWRRLIIFFFPPTSWSSSRVFRHRWLTRSFCESPVPSHLLVYMVDLLSIGMYYFLNHWFFVESVLSVGWQTLRFRSWFCGLSHKVALISFTTCTGLLSKNQDGRRYHTGLFEDQQHKQGQVITSTLSVWLPINFRIIRLHHPFYSIQFYALEYLRKGIGLSWVRLIFWDHFR